MFRLKKFKIADNGINNSFVCKTKLDRKNNISFDGNDNHIILGKNFPQKRISVVIKGNNNQITIGDNFEKRGHVVIHIVGNNNKIEIGNNVRVITSLRIFNLQQCNGGYIKISDNCAFYDSEFHLYDNHSSIEIGEDCIFAYNAVIHATDGHAIFQNKKLINKAEKCVIGNHVWIGRNALILKNSIIPDGCIVAANTTICKKYDIKNAILTNNGIVKTNICWDRCTINEVLNEK